MKQMAKRACGVLLALALLCGLTACGSDGGNTNNTAAKEHVFRAEDVKLELEKTVNNARNICKVGERLYMMSYTWGETGQEPSLVSMNMDGTDAKIIELAINSEQSDNSMGGFSDGGIAVPEMVDPRAHIEPAEEPAENGETDMPAEESDGENETQTAGESDGAEEPAETDGDAPAETESVGSGDTPAETESVGSSDTSAETEGEGSGDLPAETDGDAPADSDLPAAEPDIDKYPDDAVTVSYGYNINNMVSDGANLYLLVDEYYNDYRDQNNPIYNENYFLVGIDSQGKEIWRQELAAHGNDSETYTYVNSIVGISQGVLCGIQNDAGNGYMLFDASGNKTDEFTLEIEDAGNFFVNGKGDLYLSYWGETDGSWQQILCSFDLATKTLSEPLSVPGLSGYNLNVCQNVYGGEYDLYFYDTIAVYGYKTGDADKTEIMNFIDSDLDSSYMNSLAVLDDRALLMLSYDYTANNYEGQFIVSRLTKVDPADVKDKTVLQLACYGNLWELRPLVIAFNKSNENYRIQINDYQSYDEANDWEAGITRLNNDIVSGNVPDILYLNDRMPISSYISKGLFADLYPMIDADADMKREDFLSNILEAYSVDGKLYQLVPSFSVNTVVGKTKYVGETPGWTLADLQAILPSLPDGIEIFPEMTQENFLYTVMNLAGGRFVDWKNGTCNFDSEEFIGLLEFCSTFPKEIDYEALYNNDSYWTMQETMYREDRALLSQFYLSNYHQYLELRYGSFGEEITMIGFPSAPGNGATINANLNIAISAKSKNQDGAWEFVRGYLLSEYQDTVSYAWPLRLDRLEEMKADAKQKPYWEDPTTGEREEYEDTYYINGEELTLPIMSDEEIQYVTDFLTSVSEVAVYDTALQTIVVEEAAAYFSGQKSAKEVAGVIQSRASIYVSENR